MSVDKLINNDILLLEECLKQEIGLDISAYDQRFINKMLKLRVVNTNSITIDGYLKTLHNNPTEIQKFCHSLNVSYTEFFRNQQAFANLRHWILPKMFRTRRNNAEIRVWSAGCSTGQEAYSIAIIMREIQMQSNTSAKYRIFASDMSETSLDVAKRGEYAENHLDNVPLKFIKEYFVRNGANYQISKDLVQSISFVKYDLLDNDSYVPHESIFGNFDLVFCNNLLYYYRSDQQKQIIRKLIYATADQGYLVTGETERYIMGSLSGIHMIAPPAAIYMKNWQGE